MTQLEVDEKTPEGILEKRIFLIEERSILRVEIAFMLNRRTWTFQDFEEVLKKAGFSSVTTQREAGELFTVAAK